MRCHTDGARSNLDSRGAGVTPHKNLAVKNLGAITASMTFHVHTTKNEQELAVKKLTPQLKNLGSQEVGGATT